MNDYGSSLWSPTLDLVVAPLPSAPESPTKQQLLSSQTSIYVTWAQPTADVEIITGYQLFMYDAKGGENELVYDGSRNPNQLHFNMQSLTAGNEYGFSVVAYNFNGFGPASPTAMFKSCTAPSG